MQFRNLTYDRAPCINLSALFKYQESGLWSTGISRKGPFYFGNGVYVFPAVLSAALCTRSMGGWFGGYLIDITPSCHTIRHRLHHADFCIQDRFMELAVTTTKVTSSRGKGKPTPLLDELALFSTVSPAVAFGNVQKTGNGSVSSDMQRSTEEVCRA